MTSKKKILRGRVKNTAASHRVSLQQWKGMRGTIVKLKLILPL